MTKITERVSRWARSPALPWLALCLSVVAVVVSVCALPGADLGSVPAWISATGTVGTFVAAGIAAKSYLRSQESELEMQASQARLVVKERAMTLSKRAPDGSQQWSIVFKNRSEKPIHYLQIHSVRAVVENDGSGVPLVCISETPMGKNGMTIRAGGIPAILELGPKAEFETSWAFDESAKCPPGVRSYQITFFDANGRAWEVIDNCEPRKLRRPNRPRDLMTPVTDG